jgi:hypothetical protein
MDAVFSTSSLSEGEVAVLFWATIGGIAVFIGLLLEKFAEWMDDRFLGGTHKPHKTLESVGWCILMLGIFVEIAVAAWSANDAWQTRQMAIKSDPLNRPISEISATVSIRMKYFTNELPRWRSSAVAWLTFPGTNFHELHGFLQQFELLQSEDFATEISVNAKTHETSKRYILHFHVNDLAESRFHDIVVHPSPGVLVPAPTPKDVINRVPVVQIDAKFIPHDAEVAGGSVTLLMNGNIPRYFEILPQKAFPPPIGLGTNTDDCGFTMLATNSPVAVVTPLGVW